MDVIKSESLGDFVGVRSPVAYGVWSFLF
jgi:hypothetical protein